MIKRENKYHTTFLRSLLLSSAEELNKNVWFVRRVDFSHLLKATRIAKKNVVCYFLYLNFVRLLATS